MPSGAPAHQRGGLVSLSVVIPTVWSRPAVPEAITSALRSAALLGSDVEVLVVGNGPRSRPEAVNLRAPGLRVLHLDRASAPAARNAGIAAARHDAVAFTDDDCRVPAEWCAAMDRALNHDGHVAVAAPVDLTVSGPVTRFLDYQRYFDAPAIDSSRARYLITANAGFRRDLAPADVRFDDRNFNNAAEDSDFGYRLGDRGVTLHWLGSAPPAVHVLSESVTQITERFARYGRANARLYRRCGRWREAVPGGLGWYQDIVRGGQADQRRFDEIVSAPLRRAFCTYDLLVTASFLMGYLEEMSAELAYPLIAVDRAGLAAGWQRVAGELGEVPAGDRKRLSVDFGRLGSSAALDPEPIRAISAVLRRHATPAARVPEWVLAELNLHAGVFDQEIERVGRRLSGVVDELAARRHRLTPATLHGELRALGTTFSDGCHDLERAMASRFTGAGADRPVVAIGAPPRIDP